MYKTIKTQKINKGLTLQAAKPRVCQATKNTHLATQDTESKNMVLSPDKQKIKSS